MSPAHATDRREESLERVLLVRPSALGDVARTVGCLVSLRKAHPEARIDWLVNAGFADAVRHHPMLNEVIPFDRRSRVAFFTLMQRLRATRYDAVYDLQGLARSGALTWATRALRRVGFADAREFGWLGYTRRHRVDATHTVDRMHGLLAADGIDPVADLRLYVPPGDRRFTAALIEHDNASLPGSRDTGNIPQQPYDDHFIALAPTAQWGCKCWPVERYAALAERLLREGRASWIAVLAAPAERQRVIDGFANVPPELLGCLCIPPTTVGQMMDLIARARLLICNDSAPLHLAVGLDTPTVSLFGPTDPARVGPYPWTGKPARHVVLRPATATGRTFNYRRHRDDDTLIAQLSPDEVWEAVHQALVQSDNISV